MWGSDKRYGWVGVALPLGVQTDHVAEAMDSLQNTKLVKERGVLKVSLEGDSLNII